MKTMLTAVMVCVAAICSACGEPWAVEPSCMDGYDYVAPEKVKEILECTGSEYVDYVRDRVDTIILVRGDKCPCDLRTPEGRCEKVGCAYVKDGCRMAELRDPTQLPIGEADTLIHEAAHHDPSCYALSGDANEACAQMVDEEFWKQALHCQFPVPR